jgi:hypothetical protein
MDGGMKGKKIYLQPATSLIDAVLDIAELQNGRLTYSDTSRGVVHFRISMYGARHELRFNVTDIGKNRCRVLLGTDADKAYRERWIRREFALLDSMLVTGAQLEIADAEVWID